MKNTLQTEGFLNTPIEAAMRAARPLRPGDLVRVFCGPHYGRLHRVLDVDGALVTVRLYGPPMRTMTVHKCDVEPHDDGGAS